MLAGNKRDAIEIEEEADYFAKTPTLKEIALQQIRRISELYSKELVGGFWQEKPFKVGDGIVMTKHYNPHYRIGYCNAVDFLADLIYPYSDDDYQKYLNKIYEEDEDGIDIKDKVKVRVKLFRETLKLIERVKFFDDDSVRNE